MTGTIRAAALRDWDGYRAAFGSVAAEGEWIARELPIDWDAFRPRWEAAVADPSWLSLVAEVDGEVVGWAVSELQAGRATLGMGLVASHRGRGLGSQLLTAVVDWARAQDAHKVCLELWSHNAPALGLYEKVGFVVEGQHPRHWRRRDGSLWDCTSMGLVLDETSPGRWSVEAG